MLKNWLRARRRKPNPYSDFDVVDIDEISRSNDKVRSYLSHLLTSSRFDDEFLAALCQEIGWESVRANILARQIPTHNAIKRGDFGEVLANAVLEQFFGYTIPVPKLKYKVVANQTLPGTDSVAIKLNDSGQLDEICFVESKLRTTSDAYVVVQAHNQLLKDYNSILPEILVFIAQRLFETGDPLFEVMTHYMRNRADTTSSETFCIALCCDANSWSETVLENLRDNGIELPVLAVHVTMIRGLSTLIDDVAQELGLTVGCD